MSGFVRNSWKDYLNGFTSVFNFNYEKETKHTEPVPPTIPLPLHVPSALPSPSTSTNHAAKQTHSNHLMPPMIRGGRGNKRVTKHNKKSGKKPQKHKRVTKK